MELNNFLQYRFTFFRKKYKLGHNFFYIDLDKNMVDNRTPEEQMNDTMAQIYGFGLIISVGGLAITPFVNVEDEKDEKGKVIIDTITKTPKQKLTTSGITLIVLFSLMLAAIISLAIYRNVIMKPTPLPIVAKV
jgi:hypothetical protein